ncbi:MAG: ATP-binding protein, partial [Gemmatimonadales bacterium]
TNPCPCGRLGDPSGRCICPQPEIDRYTRRISGPLADRIDMHVTVGSVALKDLSAEQSGEPTRSIRNRVSRARATQRGRYTRLRGVTCNAHASGRWLDIGGDIGHEARAILQNAAIALSLSARGYHRVLKVARTIADLDESLTVGESHVAEALRYRPAAPAP